MIRIIFVGKAKEEWLNSAMAEYIKRLDRFTKLEIIEVKDEKITGTDTESVKRKEGERILSIVDDDFTVALEIRGKTLSSEEFAENMKSLVMQNKKLTFICGGALGLSDEVLQRCRMKLSLSRMTFTNQMVRLILIEQIYRAFMINAGMEYHK